MADLRISEASQEPLRARLVSPEGKEALSSLVGLIVEAAVDAMPPEMLQTLDTPEGLEAFLAAWPDIVAAYLQGVRKVPRRGAAKRLGKKDGKGGSVDLS